MGSLANQYLGLPNDTSNAQFATRILAIEFDIVQNVEFFDINHNHLRIDLSSLISNVSEPAAYYLPGGNKANNSVNLKSGDPIQAWIEYNSQENLTSVTVSPLGIPRPSRPLISFPFDLSSVLNEYMLTCDHGIIPQTTHIVGTLGYLAPDLTKTGKAATRTDVYGYDALMLEVATEGRPIEPKKSTEELVLVDWVRELKSRGEVTKASDPTLEEYNPDEAELVLGLGLLCSHPNPDFRPSMRRVVQFLLGDVSLPQLPHDHHLEASGVITDYSEDSDPSCGIGTSTKSTSLSSFDKKVFSKHATRVTF
ncbi:hypothetical protein Acr_06g0011040 [Actinidia rufa]|uniref:Legume lectin domain-containing protein n=1 Tax=Actinidia rufa TaxID=165716 RepID=A0A7J0ERQ0_9ERIC|nr:hypothetical protein Acr_06g0011040 [Actinidia rufa]